MFPPNHLRVETSSPLKESLSPFTMHFLAHFYLKLREYFKLNKQGFKIAKAPKM
ncbi:unnamed protein product [Meloidogyne enterolobii]|uniref:Uncharacterized protein n=1 Tax=Meloidogyne enterolobii TaxID=390850 RepID=A0ACB0YU31_MELEN